MESIQIYLNSINADKYNNGLTSDCEFNLPNLEIPDGYHIYLSVNQCSIREYTQGLKRNFFRTKVSKKFRFLDFDFVRRTKTPPFCP